MTWETLRLALAKWHADRDRVLGRRVFTFLEQELRLMVPPLVRRAWPEDLVDDVLRSVLAELAQNPLKEGVLAIQPYLRRLLRNRFIDGNRRRRRRAEVPLTEVAQRSSEDVRVPESLEVALRHNVAHRVNRALEQLSMADRVGLKLVEAPEWLNEDELSWLARRAGRSVTEVQTAIVAARDVHALTRMFDPGDDDADDRDARRRRMERFRRRRERALKKLRPLLTEDET